ncbi:unnamed protein product [Pseudo-nitzschia multistriata]|uniref:TRAPPC10/Trs130 N-terminal domain-containing protein n=1 Tax=Pseudo-nitzschia multistriata TaxID=183589 RepID=A0A448ZMG3_9STRA|nr:unnamed protein product [Pseudo-nitzschia multistriata]
MADKKSKDEGTPPKQKFNYTASSSLSVANSNSGAGFFSLGESNIAERAKQLKIERRATMEHAKQQIEKKERRASMQHKNNVGNGENGVHDTANESKGKNDSEKKTVNEFDSLLISNQVNEIDNVLYKSLAKGFQRFREQRRIASSSSSSVDGGGAVPSDKPKYFATVNFIDPTTKAESSSESSSSNSPKSKVKNMLQQQKGVLKKIGGSSKSISASLTVENVYENLTYIFERDYGSVLRSVQYKSVRTGETNFISKLPVRPVITRNGSTVDSTEASTPDNPNTPWGGAALTAMTPVSDPSEWHTGPFCHVYIAACENLDHYKDKIRPALRAFTTQLESTASNTTANQQGGHSADYMIVYVPVGDGRNISYQPKPATPTANKTNNNTGRMGLLGMARQRFGGGSMSEHGRNDDAISKNSIDSGDDAFFINGDPNADGDGDESCPINVLSALQHLSKTERSLYKKIVTDFPNGKVSVLSTGSLDRSPPSEEGLSIMVQEWHVFNRMLGTVVVNGFQDRIRRYTNELKRLDAQRATAATAAKNYESGGAMSSKPQKPNPYAFNLSHFFLVKESLASSYEQMQLPGEALLQYDEFRLYMPDLTDKEESKVRHARSC